jgi:sialidase-1
MPRVAGDLAAWCGKPALQGTPGHPPRFIMLSTLTILFVSVVAAAGLQNDQPALEQSPIFVSGTEEYHTYRIPSLIVSGKGTLLAFCEGRKEAGGDSGNIDLLLRRSTDGGKTWGKTQVLWDDGPNTCGNPCPVVDSRTGTIWLLLSHNLGSDTEDGIEDGTSKGTRTAWVTKSRDDGATWDPPTEITRAVKHPDWTWHATGPGVGIQLRSGRLVVPCNDRVAGSKTWQSNVILSDNGGKTWRLGGIVEPGCDECQIVELADGRLMLNMRSNRGNHCRAVAISADRGETFTPLVDDPALVEPVCQGSILGLAGGNEVVFSNPASTRRERMTVRLSADGGKSWPCAKVLHDGPAAYSCLAHLGNGQIACLYERGEKSPYETIALARFSRGWLVGPTSTKSAIDQGSWRQKEFLITFWSPPPPDDRSLAAVAAEHYNLTWASEGGLDRAARHGLRVMLQSDLLSPATLDDPQSRAQLDALIERVKHHPALEAYFLTDEPGAGAFLALGKLVAYLREHDPIHLAYINLYPTYASEQQLGVTADAAARARVGIPQNFSGVGTTNRTVLAYADHIKKYLEIVKPDLISYDHYHFLKSEDGNQYFLNLGLIRQAALDARKPFLNIIQASTVEPTWRLPNAQELRFLAFTTMAYGGRGISYFLYWGSKAQGGLYQDGKPSPLARDAAALNAEISRFGPVLLALESTAVYHTAPLPYGTTPVPPTSPVQFVGLGEFVLGLFDNDGKTNALMVVNRSYGRTATATLKISLPGGRIEEFNRQSGQWTGGPPLAADRILHVTLNAGDGRLFRIGP